MTLDYQPVQASSFVYVDWVDAIANSKADGVKDSINNPLKSEASVVEESIVT